MGLKMFLASFGQFLATFWSILAGRVANLLSILAAAKQVVYSKEYTVSGIPRALLVGLLIEVLGLHLMDPGMDRRAAVFVHLVSSLLKQPRCVGDRSYAQFCIPIVNLTNPW